jgi:hypothetical protein
VSIADTRRPCCRRCQERRDGLAPARQHIVAWALAQAGYEVAGQVALWHARRETVGHCRPREFAARTDTIDAMHIFHASTPGPCR